MSDHDDMIARAEASLKGVTPGPWVWNIIGEIGPTSNASYSMVCDVVCEAQWPNRKDNAHFIAASRQLVPELIAALRGEKEARERAEAELAAGSFYKETDIDALIARAERAEATVAAAYRDAAQTVECGCARARKKPFGPRKAELTAGRHAVSPIAGPRTPPPSSPAPPPTHKPR